MDDKSLGILALSEQRVELIALMLMEEMDTHQEIRPSQQRDSCEFPLSFAQQQLWFLDRLKPDNYVYNESVAVRLSGKLNLAVLEQSLNEIIRRHESLRTTFTLVEGRPSQVVAAPQPVSWISRDLSGLSQLEQNERIQALAIEETQTPFDLNVGPLLRLSLLDLAEDTSVVLLTIHHIISDGWSMGIFVKELAALYTAFLQGFPSPLPELSIQYSDFTIWQRQWLQGEVLSQLLTYWKTQLRTPLPTLQLPLDHPRPAVQSFQGATHFFQLPAQLSADLKALEQQEGATLFMVLLAAFNVLLHYHSGQDDLVVGTDMANRNLVETEDLIGLFVNQLVLRTNLAGNPSFREVLRHVREVALDAFSHRDLPFDRLVEALNPARDLSRTPLFQVKFVLQNAPMPPLALPELTLSLIQFDRGIAKFDLLLNMWETANGLSGALDYNTDLFDGATIVLLLEHFAIILKQIIGSLESDMHLDVLGEILNQADEEQRVQRYQKRRFANRQILEKMKRGKPGITTV
jgi:hypothetical protein